jgi:hypothetical protein
MNAFESFLDEVLWLRKLCKLSDGKDMMMMDVVVVGGFGGNGSGIHHLYQLL